MNVSFINKTTIRLQKLMWHPSEIVLGKCFNFVHDVDKGTMECDVTVTSSRAIYEFIAIAFKSFNESIADTPRREMFFDRLEAVKGELGHHAGEVLKAKLPYFDQLYAHQVDVLKESFYKQFNFLAMDMGTGKAQPLNSLICTPSGFKKMRDIRVGDMVIGSNGKSCLVEGIFPQGVKDIYRIYFSDNTSVDCCDDHLWIIKRCSYKKSDNWTVKPLSEIKNDLTIFTDKRRLKWKIPLTNPVLFNFQKKLKIHPYLVGLLIGDGCLRNMIYLATSDKEIISYCKKIIPKKMKIRKSSKKENQFNYVFFSKNRKDNILRKRLIEIGLFNKLSAEKFIPKDYLHSSVKDRIELLRGLMDSDGSAGKDGSARFCSSSKLLIEDISFLIQSLGGIAKKVKDKDNKTSILFNISVQLPNEINPFRLKRKSRLIKQRKFSRTRNIKKIEFIGKSEAQCIKVTSEDHSYLTDNFTVTHNTITSASISRIHKIPRTVIISPAAVKFNWYRDLKKFGFNELYFTVFDSTKRRTFRAFNERFVIINYDIIGNFEKEICSSEVGHFILDEATYIKNHTSLRFKRLKAIMERFPGARITFLSGTPVKNRVNDVFAYLKLVGHELGKNHKKFLTEYTIQTRGRGGERVTGGRNLQDLHVKLSNFMIRKTKEECLDLPDKIFFQYRYELDDYRTEYNKVIEEIAQQKDISTLTGSLHSLNIITSKAKLHGIKEIAQNIIDEDRKVVIFGGYREPLNELEKHFGDSCVKIDGSVSSWQRDQNIQKFIEDPGCKVFLGNMIAAGVGINLVNASDVIFLNFPFTPSELYQCIDRCHRIGQNKSVNVHYTFCDQSIDDYIYEIIVDKEGDINALIDHGKEVLLRENITEILIKKLLNKNEEATDVAVPEIVSQEGSPTSDGGALQTNGAVLRQNESNGQPILNQDKGFTTLPDFS